MSVINQKDDIIITQDEMFNNNISGRWTEQETKTVVTKFQTHTVRQITTMLPNRTYDAVKKKIERLGLIKKSNGWTNGEIKLLKENYNKYTNKEIKDKFLPNRSLSAISKKAREYILSKDNDTRSRTHKKWTEEEEQIMIDNYNKIAIFQLMSMLPRHKKHDIRDKAYRMQITNKYYR